MHEELWKKFSYLDSSLASQKSICKKHQTQNLTPWKKNCIRIIVNLRSSRQPWASLKTSLQRKDMPETHNASSEALHTTRETAGRALHARVPFPRVSRHNISLLRGGAMRKHVYMPIASKSTTALRARNIAHYTARGFIHKSPRASSRGSSKLQPAEPLLFFVVVFNFVLLFRLGRTRHAACMLLRHYVIVKWLSMRI